MSQLRRSDKSFSEANSTTYSVPVRRHQRPLVNGANVRLLTINLFCRPAFITNAGTNDLKFERLRQFCDLYLDQFDVICFQELFSWLGSWKEQMVHEA